MYLDEIFCFVAVKGCYTRNVYYTTKVQAEKERLLFKKKGYEVSEVVYSIPLNCKYEISKKKGGDNE